MNICLASQNGLPYFKLPAEKNVVVKKSVIRKIMRVGFLSVILFLTASLQLLFGSPVKSQTIDDVKIHIGLNDETLVQAFHKIEAQTSFRFMYRKDEVGDVRNLEVKSGNRTVGQLLRTILSGTSLTYQQVNNQVLIMPLANSNSSFSANLVTTPRMPQYVPRANIVKGRVTNQQGEPLAGVSVTLKGTKTGTLTDENGNYSLDVPPDGIIVFSFVGFETREMAVNGRDIIDITLVVNVSELDQVVVVGYGTQKRVNVTGAVDAVGSEVFKNRSTSNATQALQGVIPNLNLMLEDGKPTRSASYNIRGRTSIGQGGNALVLIDGVEGDPLFLNPNDIESVSVLKDAASAAIYGARGSFGVVLITTKQPEKGRTTITYSGNLTSQSLAKRPKFVTDAVTWLEHFREAYYNALGTIPTSINNNTQYYSDDYLERMRQWKASGADPKTEILPNGNYEYYTNTDWMGMLFKDQTLVQDHNLSLSGGTDKSNFYISGRLYDFAGMYNYYPDTYRSYNLRAKYSLRARDWLKVFNNFEFSKNNYDMPYSSQGRNATIQNYIEVNAFPSMPMYNPDGSYTRGGAGTLGGFIDGNNYQYNKLSLFKNTVGVNTYFFDNVFRINGDFTFRYNDRDFLWKRVRVPYYNNANVKEPSYLGDANGVIYQWGVQTMYTASNIYVEYENTLAQKHYIKAMTGWNYETSAYKANSLQRNQLLLESVESVELATGSPIVGAKVTNWQTAGAFLRLNYGYADRYLLEINGRYDGSSRFPVDQQWGFFPSLSAGWRLSEEPFWKVSENVFSNIKFRASYGSLGNGNIPPYQFLDLLSFSTSGRVLDGNLNSSTRAPAPIPSGLTWEKATTTDFGLDFRMIGGKLSFTGDYYTRKTTGMYVAGPTLPDVFGAPAPKGNYADMTTKGFEVTLLWQDKLTVMNKPFNYEIRGSFFDYVSRIDKFNNPTLRFTDYYNGMTIGEIWGFKTDGLFHEDPAPEDYINTIFQVSADAVWRAGDLKIKNLDGSTDNMITKGDQTIDNPGDMTIIGNSEPRYQYSFKLSAEWHSFFFSVFLHGVGRQDWYPGKESAFWGQYNRAYNQMPAWHLDNYWTPDNLDAYLPRYTQGNGSLGFSNHVPNDRYLQRVSYLRLKNVQLGYTFPISRWLAKTGLRNVQIFVSGENIASWSPLYKVAPNFMDVASATGKTDSDLNSNADLGSGSVYPLLKSYSFGLSVTF